MVKEQFDNVCFFFACGVIPFGFRPNKYLSLLKFFLSKPFLSGYVKVFSHNTAGGFFNASNSPDDVLSKNPTDPDADLYSILDTLENYRDAEGKFRFKICYSECTGVNGGRCNEWKQTTNFATESFSGNFAPGYEAIEIAWNLNGNGQPWGGLGKNVATAQSRNLIDDTPTSSNYWMSVGAFQASSTSGSTPRMLGPRSTVGNFQVTRVEIFVNGRIL